MAKNRPAKPLKTFLIAMFLINVFGIGVNFLLLYFNIPNQITNLLNATILLKISFALSYILFCILLYLIIKFRYNLLTKNL